MGMLVVATGSISAHAVPEYCNALRSVDPEQHLIASHTAQRLVPGLAPELTACERRDWDAVVVLPATAHWLAGFATGNSSSEVVNVCMNAPSHRLHIFPVMHSTMWNHPAVQANCKTIIGRGSRLYSPRSLAGVGGKMALAPPALVARLVGGS